MRLSQFFLPTLKEVPAEAQIVSHQLMLRAGMIRQASAGIYSWLPLGFRVLKRIEQIVREEQNAAGCQEMLMPTIQPADLWRESGRFEDYGKEMLRLTDRHDREMLYGPTNEELITDVFRTSIQSYRDLPQLLYHIQWKFRDELRPRFGVMRGREFLMKDSYSFDIDYESSRISYLKMFLCYLRTFARMQLRAVPMKADPGPIGGDLSHEFVILAPNGESEVFYDNAIMDIDILSQTSFGDLESVVKEWTDAYAATDDMHNVDQFEKKVPPERRVRERGIEVGHVFAFGTKYSKAMGAKVVGPDGQPIDIHMGSYGIGVSRLVGAIIEASHDENGIIWPEPVAPFKVGLINLKTGDRTCDMAAEQLYESLRLAGVEVLYDDRRERAGVKFANMDLIGLPYQVTIGPRGLKSGLFEVKKRKSGKRYELSVSSLMAHLTV